MVIGQDYSYKNEFTKSFHLYFHHFAMFTNIAQSKKKLAKLTPIINWITLNHHPTFCFASYQGFSRQNLQNVFQIFHELSYQILCQFYIVFNCAILTQFTSLINNVLLWTWYFLLLKYFFIKIIDSFHFL